MSKMLKINFHSIIYIFVFIILIVDTVNILSENNYKSSVSSHIVVDDKINLSEINYDSKSISVSPVVQQHEEVNKGDWQLESSTQNQIPIPINDDEDDENNESYKVDDMDIFMEKIKTLNGFVRGKFERNPLGDKLCVFYGIPFAEPPLGLLRFKSPVPIKNWSTTFEATHLPNKTCYQVPVGGSNSDTLSEDCLYLNLWIPLSYFKNRANPSEKLSSVMIWIHGGGFIMGSSTSDNGSILAGRKNIIFGSMQYRIGPLGFLYFGREDAPGNMGLLDQLLALRWFQNNLKQFGGNPSNDKRLLNYYIMVENITPADDEVTIFGESAGAFSIGYHLLSTLSRPLFKRAIIMSGISTSTFFYRNQTNAIDFSYDFAKFMGCYSMKDKQNLNQVMRCLRKVNPKKIIKFWPMKKFYDVPAGVTVDGYFLTDTPENLLNKPITNPADIIIGNINEEIIYFLLLDFKTIKYFLRYSPPEFPYWKFSKIMHIVFRDLPQFEMDAINSHYTNWENLEDGNANRKQIIAAGTGRNFICPSVKFAKEWAAKGSNVYFYLFDQKNTARPPWLATVHGDDVEYIRGDPLTNSSRSSGDKALSRLIQKLFTTFAKVGVPSENWETYTNEHPVFIRLNSTIISDTTTSNIFGPNAEDCQFWNYDLPKLIEYYNKESK